MRRWFLSYHSPDSALAERLAAAIEHRDRESRVFLAAKSLRAGGAWQEALSREIAQAAWGAKRAMRGGRSRIAALRSCIRAT
jgi:hypothetical protein